MQKQGTVGVYRLYKLSRGEKDTFTNEFKKVLRDLHVVTHSYAEAVNEHSEKNGLEYSYDEKASNLYWQKKTFKNTKEYTDFKEIENTEVNDVEELLGTSLEELRLEYEDLANKKPNSLWKEKKLQEEINKLK